jgi:hypothetical protein
MTYLSVHAIAGFGTTFRVTGGYLKAGTSFLKRVTGGLS